MLQNVKSRVRVKICGLTRTSDAIEIARAGADAIGLVFYPESPRFVTPEKAREIARSAGPFVTVTALFVDADVPFIQSVIENVQPDLLQFHGGESPRFCEQFNRPYLKALRVRPGLNIESEINRYDSARGILLDTYRKGVPGGTGEVFDWDCVPQNPAVPIVLAGGLSPNNVRQAIEKVNPYGVDVSGGVESSPGCKDLTKVAEFIHEVQWRD